MTGFDFDEAFDECAKTVQFVEPYSCEPVTLMGKDGARALVTEALYAADEAARRALLSGDSVGMAIRALIPKPPEPPTSKKDTMNETAWLIEDRTCPTTLYWGPTSGCHSQWTTPDLAVRFVSREDAQRVAAAIVRVVGQRLEVHEHAWTGVHPAPPDPMAEYVKRLEEAAWALAGRGRVDVDCPCWDDPPCDRCNLRRALASKPKEAQP